MIPNLPEAAIRQALADADWDTLKRLIDGHDRDVRAFADAPASADPAIWRRLREQHAEMMAVLGAKRDESSAALRRSRQTQSGIKAYAGAAA